MTTYLFDLETTNINPYIGEISHVAFIELGGKTVKIWTGRESDLLRSLVDFITNDDSLGLIGFNIMRYDIPFMQVRFARSLGMSDEQVYNMLRKPYVADMRQYHIVGSGFSYKGISLKKVSGMNLRSFSQVDPNNHLETCRYIFFQMCALASIVNKVIKNVEGVRVPYTNVEGWVDEVK